MTQPNHFYPPGGFQGQAPAQAPAPAYGQPPQMPAQAPAPQYPPQGAAPWQAPPQATPQGYPPPAAPVPYTQPGYGPPAQAGAPPDLGGVDPSSRLPFFPLGDHVVEIAEFKYIPQARNGMTVAIEAVIVSSNQPQVMVGARYTQSMILQGQYDYGKRDLRAILEACYGIQPGDKARCAQLEQAAAAGGHPAPFGPIAIADVCSPRQPFKGKRLAVNVGEKQTKAGPTQKNQRGVVTTFAWRPAA